MGNEIKILNKNIDLNNICTDYSISALTNSYILSYYSNSSISYYDSVIKDNNVNNIDNFTNIIDEETGLSYFNIEKSQFNLKETYNFNESLLTNNLIISNIGNRNNSYSNSYIIYYNTNDGLKQLSYHYKEGNGIYYDKKNHLIGMNIDNNTIKEINKKLYFDTNSIPISSSETYGISYVNNEYLEVNNGILTIKEDIIENLISYKYKIKNLYNNLNSIFSAFSYYDDIYFEKNDTTNFFAKYFNNVVKHDKVSMLNRNISYENSSSLYFPNSALRYIDNYYIAHGLIDKKYQQFIDLNDNNSYIIYCKDLEQIQIYSYLENKYVNYSTQFNDNILNDIEYNKNGNYLSLDNVSIIDNNDIYSYIFIDELNEYNKILVSPNVVNQDIYKYNNVYYSYTVNKIKYYSRSGDEKIFKNNGIILNSKMNISNINKCIINYYIVDNNINYNFEVKKINIKYDNKNIKILYDDRDISYCVCNTEPIPLNKSAKYFFISIDPNNQKYNSIYETINSNNGLYINNYVNLIIKNSSVSFNTSNKYLFYGYNWTINSINMYNKKYYSIWEDLPTSYIIPSFIYTISDSDNKLILFNFDEIYTENFSELDFNYNPNEPNNNPDSYKLYLCKLEDDLEGKHTIKFVKSNNNPININI